jgi:SAM-dependent methyltransferase
MPVEAPDPDAFKQAAIDYPRRLDAGRRAYLYTKPFGPNPWGDDFCGKLHDFAHLVELLRLPHGAAILDVGCGSGWLSEYFARLGYDVTGIDISPDLIDIARERVQGLSFAGGPLATTFAVMDSEHIALARQFDAAVVYDALHHFADERAVLRGIHGCLKPGGRVFLKEPLAHHPEAAETRAEVAAFGVLERGFTRDELVASLTDAGFLPPVALRQVDLMIDDRRVAPGYVAAALASTPTYHLFHAAKPGPGAVDSRCPGRLAAAIDVVGLPSRLERGATIDVEVLARNTGDTVWLHTPMRYGGHVRLGVVLLGADGAVIDPELASAFMTRDVAPGDTATFRVTLRAPAAAGRYVIRADLVDEFITWFRERGSPTADATVDVR